MLLIIDVNVLHGNIKNMKKYPKKHLGDKVSITHSYLH